MELLAALLPALFGGLIGTLVGAFLQRRRDIQNQQREAAKQYLQRQIENLYAPLFCYRQRADILHKIYRDIIGLKDGEPNHPETLEGDAKEVWVFFTEHYFLKLNEQIRETIFSNYHLLEEAALPPSYINFIEHELQYRTLYSLEKHKSIFPKNMPDRSFPEEFDRDINVTLHKLKNKYQSYFKAGGRRLLFRGSEKV